MFSLDLLCVFVIATLCLRATNRALTESAVYSKAENNTQKIRRLLCE